MYYDCVWVLCTSNVDEQGSKPARWYKFFWIFAQTASHAPQSNTTSTSRRRRRRSRYRLCTYRESSVIVFCSVERLRVAKSSKGLAEIGKRPNSTPVLFLASRSSLLNASSPSILPFFPSFSSSFVFDSWRSVLDRAGSLLAVKRANKRSYHGRRATASTRDANPKARYRGREQTQCSALTAIAIQPSNTRSNVDAI